MFIAFLQFSFLKRKKIFQKFSFWKIFHKDNQSNLLYPTPLVVQAYINFVGMCVTLRRNWHRRFTFYCVGRRSIIRITFSPSARRMSVHVFCVNKLNIHISARVTRSYWLTKLLHTRTSYEVNRPLLIACRSFNDFCNL